MRKYFHSIVYVTHALTGALPFAVDINIRQRISLMRRLGHSVTHIEYGGVWSLSGWRKFLGASKKADIIMIRIDGSCVGDMYTLVKIVYPRLRIVWEVHGFPEENAQSLRPVPRFVLKKYIRYYLSYLVGTCMYVSHELMQYAQKRLAARKHIVIPNFVTQTGKHVFSIRALPSDLRDRVNKKFVVLWGGSAQFPWQAIDQIEKLAQYVAQIDPLVLFVIAGKPGWHSIQPARNILLMHNIRRLSYQTMLGRADVCLALYHKPPQVPFYFFPMKILDYMYHGRPVIASMHPTLSSIITHGKDGFLVSDSVGDMAFLLMKLKNNPALRTSLGKRAHETVMGRYTDRVIKQAYAAMLNDE